MAITLTVMVVTDMQVLDTSITNVALPHMPGSLSAGVEEMSTATSASPPVLSPVALGFKRVRAAGPAPGSACPSAEDLIDWCRDRRSPFKVPEAVEFRTTVPRTSGGKIEKHLSGTVGPA